MPGALRNADFRPRIFQTADTCVVSLATLLSSKTQKEFPAVAVVRWDLCAAHQFINVTQLRSQFHDGCLPSLKKDAAISWQWSFYTINHIHASVWYINHRVSFISLYCRHLELQVPVYERYLLNQAIPCFSASSIAFLSLSLLQSLLKANPWT